LINEDLIRQCHTEMDGNKATGVDKVTKAEQSGDMSIGKRKKI